MTDELEDLRAEVEQLSPLSDAEIQQRVDAGEDAEIILSREEGNAARRRVLQFKINSLEAKLAEENRKNAGKELKAIDAKLDATEQQAREEVTAAHRAVDALRAAVARFKGLGDEYAAQANEAATLARQAAAAREDTRGIWMNVNALEKTLVESLSAYRAPKPHIYKLIESEEKS